VVSAVRFDRVRQGTVAMEAHQRQGSSGRNENEDRCGRTSKRSTERISNVCAIPTSKKTHTRCF